MLRILSPSVALAALVTLPLPAFAQEANETWTLERPIVEALEDGSVLAADAQGTYWFRDWSQYALSPFFQQHGMRCGTAGPDPSILQATTSDCSSSLTNPAAEYSPQGGAVYDVPVVVHAITDQNGNGFVPDALIHSQIDVLNEDFRAIAGSLGAPGTDTRIQFHLATVDPNGNATTGITRHASKKWFQDQGNYAAEIGWDPNRYLNVYLNSAGGNLGYAYVPSGGGVVGNSFDGVRILWAAFGENAPIGPPYDLGRTATHEVGHYLGLYHTFQGGCASASGCYQNGDLICDTNPEGSPNYSTCTRSSCGSVDPTHNYLDYSDDVCMYEFTSDQAHRMRCTLATWRVDLPSTGDPGPTNQPPSVVIASPANGTVYEDGETASLSASATDAEDGTLTASIAWSSSLDGPLGTGGALGVVLSPGNHVLTATVVDSGGAGGADTVSVSVASVGGGISLSGSSYKDKGNVYVDLVWSGAEGSTVDVYQNGAYIGTTANDGAVGVSTGLKGSGTLTYQVCDGGGACSAVISVGY